MRLTRQGRRRLFESGTAIEHHRRPPSGEGTCGGEHERGVRHPLVRGFGDLSHENFVIKED